jgi:hypothetical protein
MSQELKDQCEKGLYNISRLKTRLLLNSDTLTLQNL